MYGFHYFSIKKNENHTYLHGFLQYWHIDGSIIYLCIYIYICILEPRRTNTFARTIYSHAHGVVWRPPFPARLLIRCSSRRVDTERLRRLLLIASLFLYELFIKNCCSNSLTPSSYPNIVSEYHTNSHIFTIFCYFRKIK